MVQKEELRQRLDRLKDKLRPDRINAQIISLEKQMAGSGFWDNREKSAKASKELADYKKEIETLEMFELYWEEGELEQLEKELAAFEVRIFFSSKYDREPAIVNIHSGQGGVEAMDWAQMLHRMYAQYFEKQGWTYRMVEEVRGEEAGVKSVTMEVNEPFAYGYLKFEAGTHRLVRLSPFNADQLRQTSFALVEVLPQIDDDETDLSEDDLEWQFYRSSSQGGQNVQKVNTAVRLTHKPTGLVVTCQTERFQEQNRVQALKLLKAKLWKIEEEARFKEVERLKGGRTQAAWGTQIRSYVLHPYKMVKDLRTKVETSAAEKVLDGELDEFIQAEIRLLSVSG